MMLINTIFLLSFLDSILSREVQRGTTDIFYVSDSNNDCWPFQSHWGENDTCVCGNGKKNTFMSVFPEGAPKCVDRLKGKLKKFTVKCRL